MIGAALQFTMRELQRVLTSPRFWVAILAAGLLLGLLGPFGTYAALGLPARIGYWVAVAVATYLAAHMTITFMASLGTGERQGGLWVFALYGAIAGLPVAAIVWAFNASIFGIGQSIDLLPQLAYVVAIAAIVSALVRHLVYGEEGMTAEDGEAEAIAPAATAQNVRPRILDRLPLGARGQLSHLSVSDHYVDVVTDKGRALVLMRLADAIAETEGVEGMQIHRSHWVATDAVSRTVRRDGKLLVVMRNGTLLPVSRPYAGAVRMLDAGRDSA